MNCTCCGKGGSFYNSSSVLYKHSGKMPICRNCFLKLYDGYNSIYSDTKKSIYKMCEKLDIYYDEALADSAIKQANDKDSHVMRIYMQKVNSLKQFSDFTFEDTECKPEGNISGVEVISRDVRLFWGNGLTEEEYEFLENEYKKWETKHGCDKYSEEVLYKEICLTTLDIRKGREVNGNVDKKIDLLQKLMDSANIKPASAKGKDEKSDSYGMWIREVENEEPCEVFDKKPIYTDFDKFKEYIDKWVLRPLKNLLIGTRDFEFLKELEERAGADPSLGDIDED